MKHTCKYQRASSSCRDDCSGFVICTRQCYHPSEHFYACRKGRKAKGPVGAGSQTPWSCSTDARSKRALLNCRSHCHSPCNIALQKGVCVLMQEAVKAREAEILRLGQEAGKSRNLDALAFQQRCEGQETLILQLTEQVLSLIHNATCTSANSNLVLQCSACAVRHVMALLQQKDAVDSLLHMPRCGLPHCSCLEAQRYA